MKTKLTTLMSVALLIAGCASTPAPKATATPDLASYRAVVIESVRVAPAAGPMDAAHRQELERQLTIALVDSIPSTQRASKAAAGVLRVQVTVTAIDAVSPVNNGISTTLLGVPLDRGSISFDARFYSAGASEPFAQVAEQRKAGRFAFSGSFSHYGHAAGALREWGTNLAGSLTRT